MSDQIDLQDSGMPSLNRWALEDIMNYSAQLYSMRSIMKGNGVSWGKAEEESQKGTTSSAIYANKVSQASCASSRGTKERRIFCE